MRKEPKGQKRVWAGLQRLTKHMLVPIYEHILSYPKGGQPHICFHSSVRYKILEHSNC